MTGPAVDIFAGDTELVSDLSFAELSSGVQVAPGAYTLDFVAATPGSNRPASRCGRVRSRGQPDSWVGGEG